MGEHRWKRLYALHGQEPYAETAVVDVEDGCVVVDYEVLSEMLIALGFTEEVA